MKHLNLLLEMIVVTSFSALEGKEVQVLREVTGYVGQEVTLPCQLTGAQVTQVQWDFTKADGQKLSILVIHSTEGVAFHDSPLKDRVTVSKHSLVIKDLGKNDSGLYTCTMATFPAGSLEGNTNLVVREQLLLSTGSIGAIVSVVVLLLLVLAAMAYLLVFRRWGFAARHQVFIDTERPAVEVFRPSVTGDGDVVYADVKANVRGERRPMNATGPEAADVNVTYSEVFFAPQNVK